MPVVAAVLKLFFALSFFSPGFFTSGKRLDARLVSKEKVAKLMNVQVASPEGLEWMMQLHPLDIAEKEQIVDKLLEHVAVKTIDLLIAQEKQKHADTPSWAAFIQMLGHEGIDGLAFMALFQHCATDENWGNLTHEECVQGSLQALIGGEGEQILSNVTFVQIFVQMAFVKLLVIWEAAKMIDALIAHDIQEYKTRIPSWAAFMQELAHAGINGSALMAFYKLCASDQNWASSAHEKCVQDSLQAFIGVEGEQILSRENLQSFVHMMFVKLLEHRV